MCIQDVMYRDDTKHAWTPKFHLSATHYNLPLSLSHHLQKTSELHTLEDNLNSPTTTKPSPKSQCGSDGDSGVLVTTTDEQPEVFISETSRGTPVLGEQASGNSPSNPSPTEDTAGDEGL